MLEAQRPTEVIHPTSIAHPRSRCVLRVPSPFNACACDVAAVAFISSTMWGASR
jgi:hypothetical protein